MEKYVTFVEIASMLGEGSGPFLAALVSPYLGYANTMYLFGFINLFGTIVCFFIMPSVLNKSEPLEKIEQLLAELDTVEAIENENMLSL